MEDVALSFSVQTH